MLPKVNQIKPHIIRLLQGNNSLSLSEIRNLLANSLNLTEEDLKIEYNSANGNKFKCLTQWALNDLCKERRIERLKQGVYKLSIESYITSDTSTISDETPRERLENSLELLLESTYSDILSKIIEEISDYAFEKLALELLRAMGYGGGIEDAGYVTPRSKDGGIDGIIKQDILGFDRIFIQAKQYAIDRTIDKPEIQRFNGAIHDHGNNPKGVFITTAKFSSGAVECAKRHNIVLIDGKTLARYIYKYGLGMQLEKTIEIKKMDTDFWVSIEEK